MTESNPKPLVATRSLAPPPELEALDDGWSEAAHSVPMASPAPLSQISGTVSVASGSVTSAPPAGLDDLDEGWGDEPADADASPTAQGQTPTLAKGSAKASKKARRKLERDLRVQQVKTTQERTTTRKETRREAQKRHVVEAAQQAEAQRKAQAARKSAKRQAKKALTPKPLPQRVNSPVTTAVTAPPQPPSPVVAKDNALVQGWMLWVGLAAILAALAYFVARR